MATAQKLSIRENAIATQPAADDRLTPAWHPVSRAVALFFGFYSLLNLLDETRLRGSEAYIWWLDGCPCPAPVARGLLGMCVVLLFAFAIKPQMSGMRRLFSVTAVLLLFAAALFDAYSYYTMVQEAKIQADVPLPFSLHAAAALVVIFAGVVVGAGRTVRKGRNLVVGLSTLMVCFIGFPLAHMFCFGTTDFRAPADVVIVFANGPDGEAISSETMTERITTAAELYQEEFARKVVLCGASNVDASDRSAQTMQQVATRLGVPEADILLCPTDLDTSSIQATNDLLEQQGIGEVLVASQFYDIPRFKLAFHRLGTQIRTVPADQPLPLPELRPILQREFVALWQIQLEPLRELINRL